MSIPTGHALLCCTMVTSILMLFYKEIKYSFRFMLPNGPLQQVCQTKCIGTWTKNWLHSCIAHPPTAFSGEIPMLYLCSTCVTQPTNAPQTSAKAIQAETMFTSDVGKQVNTPGWLLFSLGSRVHASYNLPILTYTYYITYLYSPVVQEGGDNFFAPSGGY